MSGQVWAIAGGKGGVGKTTTAAALARAFSERDRRVAVLDADLGMGNLPGALGADSDAAAGGDLHAALAGEVPTEAAATAVDGLTVLTGGRTESAESPVDGVDLESYGEADPARLEDAIEWLRTHNDTVVIDTASGLAHETAVSVGLADGVVLLTTPDAMAVENAATTAAFVDRVGGDVVGVVVTRATGTTDPTAIADRLGYPLLGAVPEVETREADPSALVPSPGAEAYRELAGVLAAIGGGESAEAIEPANDPDWFDAGEETRDRARADGDPTPEGDDGHGDEDDPPEESGDGDRPGLLRRLLGLG